MKTDINNWEEILYEFFGKGLEYSRLVIPDDFKSRDETKIMPTRDTIQYLRDAADSLNVDYQNIVREFEKEVSIRKALMPTEMDRFQFIAGLLYKFEIYTKRLPSLEEAQAKVLQKATEENIKLDMDGLFFTIAAYIVKLKEVDDLISRSMEISRRVLSSAMEVNIQSRSQNKLKWLCKPAVSGLIMNQLFENGYLQYPVRDGEMNGVQTAKLCMDHFDFGNESPEYIKKLIMGENSISDIKRAKLKLPDANDMK